MNMEWAALTAGPTWSRTRSLRTKWEKARRTDSRLARGAARRKESIYLRVLLEGNGGGTYVVTLLQEQRRACPARVSDAVSVGGAGDHGAARHLTLSLRLQCFKCGSDHRERQPEPSREVCARQIPGKEQGLEAKLHQNTDVEPRGFPGIQERAGETHLSVQRRASVGSAISRDRFRANAAMFKAA